MKLKGEREGGKGIEGEVGRAREREKAGKREKMKGEKEGRKEMGEIMVDQKILK